MQRLTHTYTLEHTHTIHRHLKAIYTYTYANAHMTTIERNLSAEKQVGEGENACRNKNGIANHSY